jgi:hypothetical protein
MDIVVLKAAAWKAYTALCVHFSKIKLDSKKKNVANLYFIEDLALMIHT